MITPIMKFGTIAKNIPETVTRNVYVRAPYTVQVDTVKIGNIKTCQVKQASIGDKVLKTVVHIFDKNGKKIGKEKLK